VISKLSISSGSTDLIWLIHVTLGLDAGLSVAWTKQWQFALAGWGGFDSMRTDLLFIFGRDYK